jgi:hypothetical protein
MAAVEGLLELVLQCPVLAEQNSPGVLILLSTYCYPIKFSTILFPEVFQLLRLGILCELCNNSCNLNGLYASGRICVHGCIQENIYPCSAKFTRCPTHSISKISVFPEYPGFITEINFSIRLLTINGLKKVL